MNTTTPVKTAKLLLSDLPDFAGVAHLYELSEPLKDYDGNQHTLVVVSASDRFTSPETYIFPGDAEGNVTSWCELDGSFQGALDHAKALGNAGYTLTA